MLDTAGPADHTYWLGRVVVVLPSFQPRTGASWLSWAGGLRWGAACDGLGAGLRWRGGLGVATLSGFAVQCLAAGGLGIQKHRCHTMACGW
jgi:hypothetical protein